jgi:hypothetical protein
LRRERCGDWQSGGFVRKIELRSFDPRALCGTQFGAAGTAVFDEFAPIRANRFLRKNLESLVVAETSFHNSILE